MIDSHAHLQSLKFSSEEMPELIQRARAAGVTEIVCLATCLEDCEAVLALAECYPMVHACIGIHPTYTAEIPVGWLDSLRAYASQPSVVAVGEIGLDYYHKPPEGWDWDRYKARQREVFELQLDMAASLGKNAVIHQRATGTDASDFLKPWDQRLRAVFHCFEGSAEEAQALTARGHLVSFTGNITLPRHAGIEATVRALSCDQFMVETDAPYLAPRSKRGQRCEPAFVAETLRWIAEVRGEAVSRVEEGTERAAREFFGL